MDDLLSEFLTETAESLSTLDVELVRLEQNPNDPELLSNIFRLMHTIKGTCGFLGLPRLEAVAHASENVLGRIREGELQVSADGVTLVLESIDAIKQILQILEETEAEPPGDDSDLIARLNSLAEGGEAQLAEHDGSIGVAPEETVEEEDAEAVEADDAVSDDPNQPDPAIVDPELAAIDALIAAQQAEAASAQAEAETESSEPEEPSPEAAVPAAAKSDIVPVKQEKKTPAPQAKAATETTADGTPKESSVAAQTIRVSVGLLENLMTMVSELVLTRNQLLQIVRNHKDSEFSVPLQRLSHVTSELQEGVMKTRMQPIGNAWAKLPRLVRDLSIELHKKIDLQMLGADTELDRQVLELIKDPLTHMVRNSADHGIETPADRKAAGKPETGHITLNAFHEGGHILIEISDDGKGLALSKIKDKAVQNGLASEAELESMSEQQVQQLIFKPGFSTAAAVTSVSGRGVGMDVVKTNIEKIGGTVELKSVEGEGSTFIIKIPLTLAIVSALIVASCGERFAIPQLSVVELVRAASGSDNQIENINGTPVLRLRNRLLPLVSLEDMLQLKRPETDTEERRDTFIVVTQVGTYTFGIIVDRVFDTEEIVVKPVAPILRHIALFSGNTILGDGSVIMILDPNGIASAGGDVTMADLRAHDEAAAEAELDADSMTLLLFRAGDSAPKAVPLGLVARLEEVDLSKIEYSDGKPLVQYRGKLMPLITFDESAKLASEGQQPFLVFADGEKSMGLVVDEIVDIVEATVSVEVRGARQGLIGSAIVSEKATDIIDAGYFLTKALGNWFGEHGDGISDGTKGRQGHLLLVDDSPFFRNLLAPVLTVAGYHVTSVDSASAALALREKGRQFDCIISDIEMPEMDGFAFAEEVRGEGHWQETPLVALSSLTSQAYLDRGREVGFTDYVAKFDREGLLETLSLTLGRG